MDTFLIVRKIQTKTYRRRKVVFFQGDLIKKNLDKI